MVLKDKIPIGTAMKTVTSNPAGVLKLESKGKIKAGMDADLVLMNGEFEIVHLFANGNHMIENGKTNNRGQKS